MIIILKSYWIWNSFLGKLKFKENKSAVEKLETTSILINKMFFYSLKIPLLFRTIHLNVFYRSLYKVNKKNISITFKL